MAILQVRNLPDRVYARLRERAAEHRRSLTQETILLLEEALGFDTSGRNLRNRTIDYFLNADIGSRLPPPGHTPGPKVPGVTGTGEKASDTAVSGAEAPDPVLLIQRFRRTKGHTP